MEPTAYLHELFCSIQGEGPYTGRRHLFVRFERCDADCAYCDTPAALKRRRACRLETEPGSKSFREIANPVAAAALAQAIASLDAPGPPSEAVVLTGGEPLLQAGFIAHAAQAGTFGDRPLILETDGNLPGPLEKVIDRIHVVAADIKIPSATAEPANWDANEKFLAIAARTECFVKVIYAARTTEEEIATAARIVARVRRDIPFILQPVTPARNVQDRPPAGLALKLHAAAREVLPDVRVMPQTHRFLGLL